MGVRASPAPLVRAPWARARHEGEESRDAHDDTHHEDHDDADHPCDQFDRPADTVGPARGTSLWRTSPIAGHVRGRLLQGTVVFESVRASVGEALGNGEREADVRHVLHAPGFLVRPCVGGLTATPCAEGHARIGAGFARRLLDDLEQRVEVIEGVAPEACSERDATPS